MAKTRFRHVSVFSQGGGDSVAKLCAGNAEQWENTMLILDPKRTFAHAGGRVFKLFSTVLYMVCLIRQVPVHTSICLPRPQLHPSLRSSHELSEPTRAMTVVMGTQSPPLPTRSQ
jgi:hypothetical protein